MVQLEHYDFDKVRPLAQAWPLAVAVDATLDGTCPGAVWVDDPAAPTAAIVDTPEGHYVVGDPPGEDVSRSLADFILGTISEGGRGEEWWWFYLRCPSEAWAEAMRNALPAVRTVEKPREFYLCREVAFDWRDRVPAGFDLVPVDGPLLARHDLKHIGRIRRLALGNFGSVERFVQRGFAFCLIRDQTIVSACSSDNVSARGCEVGVHTVEEFRQQGLATLTVAATVDWALSQGFAQVGWHCLQFNVASAATARRVGFEKAADYSAFKVCAKVADAHVLKGNLSLIRQEFDQAAQWYEQALRAVSSEGASASNLLRRREDRARYGFQAANAQALAGHRSASLQTLAAALELAGYRQGGY